MSSLEELNPYELLDVKTEATEQEIKTAYRQRSLKVHPDRNRNNPDAARKFHELNQAYELLLDPLRRMAIDAKLRKANALKERYKSYDAKRKHMVDELAEREAAVKKARVEKDKAEVQRWREEEDIKEAGRRRMEERAAELRRLEEEAQKEKEREAEEDAPPALGDLDTTVRLRFATASHPSLVTPSALSELLAFFGPTDTDSIVVSSPATKPGKKPKKTTALVPFRQLGHAFAAVCNSGRAERGLDGVEVGWAGGAEPPILEWLKARGELGGASDKGEESVTPPGDAPKSQPVRNGDTEKPPPPHLRGKGPSGPFSTFPDIVPKANPTPPPVAGLDYESLTLMRMRQAGREREERERLEREIREAEAQE